jgi:hypothetical protein
MGSALFFVLSWRFSFLAGMPPGSIPPGAGQGLQAALASSASAPVNPHTQNDRRDPHYTALEDMQRIRRALDKALEPHEGGPPDARSDVLRMMRGVVDRMLNGVDPAQALMVGVESIVPPPIGSAGGMGIPGALPTAPGNGLQGPGASLMGGPPPPGLGAPTFGVSPGPPGQQ